MPMGKLDDPLFGNVPPDETVKLVFNLSQGEDERGPVERGARFRIRRRSRPEGGMPPAPINADDEGHKSAVGKKARAAHRAH